MQIDPFPYDVLKSNAALHFNSEFAASRRNFVA